MPFFQNHFLMPSLFIPLYSLLSFVLAWNGIVLFNDKLFQKMGGSLFALDGVWITALFYYIGVGSLCFIFTLFY